MKQIAEALLAARKEFGAVIKNASNPFFNSKYADLGGIIDAIEDSLTKHELLLIQTVTVDGLATKILHSSGEELDCGVVPIVNTADMQKLGSAITYARRYAIQSALMLSAQDDDGNAAVQAKPATAYDMHKAKINKMSQAVLDTLNAQAKMGRSLDELAKVCADNNFDNDKTLAALK